MVTCLDYIKGVMLVAPFSYFILFYWSYFFLFILILSFLTLFGRGFQGALGCLARVLVGLKLLPLAF